MVCPGSRAGDDCGWAHLQGRSGRYEEDVDRARAVHEHRLECYVDGPGSSQTPVSQRKYIVFDRSPEDPTRLGARLRRGLSGSHEDCRHSSG